MADPHISFDPAQSDNGFVPDQHVREAIADVPKAGPQAALIAGDLAWNQGLPADYTRLHVALGPLAERMPLCLMLGNHDSRQPYLAEFLPAHAGADPAVEKSIVLVEHGPIRWVLLDSLFRTDVVAGLLGKAQRSLLRRLLEICDEKPTLLCVHHPLNDDDDNLLDSDRLFQLAQAFPKVKAIVTAHDHAYRSEVRDGIHIVNLPALGMPFDPNEPVGWVKAALSAAQGTFTFHAVGENRAGDASSTTLLWR